MIIKPVENSQRKIKETDVLVPSGVVMDPTIGSWVLYLSTRNDLGAFGVGT